MRQRLRPSIESEAERKKRLRKEYLQWWFSKKK